MALAHFPVVELEPEPENDLDSDDEVSAFGPGGDDPGEPPVGRFADEAPALTAKAPTLLSWRGARDVFQPLPATKWVVPGLHICPGRPAMCAAYGATGKTLTAQSLAISVATGVPAWGEFSVTRGKVAHVDHEQGWHATAKRYQRLCMGMGIESGELDGQLFVAPLPSLYLTHERARDEYARACDGMTLVIVDALRGATVGLDENDSRIRACLDTLTWVSERTGAAFWMIHHAGKPREGHEDQRTLARGSSAIFDACGTVFVMVGSKGSPKLMSEQKTAAEAEGSALDDFTISIDDVLVGTNPRGGVRVLAKLGQEAGSTVEPGPDPAVIARAERIVEILRAKPGLSKNSIRTEAGGNSGLTDKAIAWLLDHDRIVQRPGRNGGHSYVVAENHDQP